MDRARAAHLISGGLAGDEADQDEDFSHGHRGPDFSEANARHGGGSQDPVGGPVTRGLLAHHRAFSSFNQISASKRRNRTS